MIEDKLAAALNVGNLLVDVGYDGMGTPAARTETEYLGAFDLGGTISVDLPAYAFTEFGERTEGEENEPTDGSVEMWMILLAAMRDMLASCFVLCQMDPRMGDIYGGHLDDAERENLGRAIDVLGKDFFRVDIDRAVQVIKARSDRDSHMRGGMTAISQWMQSYKRAGEESITIGEALRRAEEKE